MKVMMMMMKKRRKKKGGSWGIYVARVVEEWNE